jgi:DNA-binding transcriptional LysR family regulator
MDLDLRLVRYFVAVADELHFGRAAARLYISQPALSKQIRKLEEDLGAKLLTRDSRHVELTVRGQQFYAQARELLALATSMQQQHDADAVRIAHVFELSTSREVADEFGRRHPGTQLIARAMDSKGQLDGLLRGQLDVAILRITAEMKAAHPEGWQHRALRLEPMVLVGRPGDPPAEAASLYERPLEVFGDPPGSGSYNAHGDFLTAFERAAGVKMRWLGTPGAFSHCLAQLTHAVGSAYVLEFASYGDRYRKAGIAVHRPAELSPHYAWSLAWRSETPSAPTAALLAVAAEVSEMNRWLPGKRIVEREAWLPPDDPVRGELFAQARA